MPIYQIGIDLGTTLVRVYKPRKGILYTEPTAVAMHTEKREVVAYGEEALQMLGREPEYIKVVFPMAGGVVADSRFAEVFLRRVMEKVCGGMLVKPAVALCLPVDVTPVERQALERVAMEAGARKFVLIEEPVAAALGAGINLSKPQGHLIVDIGGGSTDVCILTMHKVISRSAIRCAGNDLNEAIVRYMHNVKSMLIGLQTAEQLKMQYGCAMDPDPDLRIPVKGRRVDGMPETIEITQEDLMLAVQEPLARIAECIRCALEVTPPELAGDIAGDGMCLTGGSAQLKHLDRYFKQKLGLSVTIPQRPQFAVAVGTGLAFRFAKQVKRADQVPLRMKPLRKGIPEMRWKRLERKNEFPNRPDWFTRDEKDQPRWHRKPHKPKDTSPKEGRRKE